MNTLRYLYRPIAIVSLTCLLGACASPNDSGHDGSIIRVGNSAEPESLDPHIAESVYAARIDATLFEGLVILNGADLTPEPGVAERWEVSDDGLRYTFHLRADAKWSNGDPVTASDFHYSWKRMLTPTLASPYSYMLYSMKNAQAYNEGKIDDFTQVGVRVVDDRTLEVTLEYPAPYFLSLHAHQTWYPVNQRVVEDFGAMDERNTKWVRAGNLVGNGPYVLTEWRPNKVISVRPNPHYWNRDSLKNDGVDFYPVSSENTEERMYRAGELDMTERIPLTKINRWRKEDPASLRVDPYSSTSYIFMNLAEAPFEDVRVRRAFTMTINREEISSRIRQGVDPPAYTFTPEGLGGYIPPTRIEENIEEAQRLLAEAGYPKGEGFPEVELLYSTSDSGKYLAVAFQEMWQKNLGVFVAVSNQEWKVFISTTNNRDYQIAMMGWGGDYLDPVTYLDLWTTDSGNNNTSYSSREYDGLVKQATTSHQTSERNRLFGEAETILLRDSPIIPIYFKGRSFLCSPRIQGFPGNLIDYRRFAQMSFAKE